LYLFLSRQGPGIGESIGARGKRSGQPFFGEGVAIIQGDVLGIHVQLGVDADMGMIHRIRIFGIEQYRATVDGDRLRNLERRNCTDRAVGQNDWLDKPGSLVGGLREKAAGSRVGTEVEIKGSVLLKQNEDVLYVFLQQGELLSMGKIRSALDPVRVTGDFRA